MPYDEYQRLCWEHDIPLDAFWGMTWREFELALEGRQRRLDRQMEMLATHAAWLINHRTPAFGEDVRKRKMLTPQQLLGRDSGPRSAEDSARIWREFIRPFKEQRAKGV